MKIELNLLIVDLVKNATTPLIRSILVDDKDIFALVYTGPTHNCQIYSIGSFECVLGVDDPDDEDPKYNFSVEQVREILKYTSNQIEKWQLLIDVYDIHNDRIEEIFNKNDIIFKQPYTNRTKSEMIMYMVNTSNF